MSREVPEGWIPIRLGALVEIERASFSINEINSFDTVRLYSLPAFDNGAVPDKAAGSEVLSNKYRVPTDCILFSKLNPRIPRVWRVKHEHHEPALGSTEFWPLTPRTGNVDLDFLTSFLISADFLNSPEITPASSTNSHQRVDRKAFENFEMLLPPLHEQRRIAEILASVDEAIAATRAVIEQTRKVKHGVLERLLTKGIGHTRFKQTEIGEIPEGWGLCALADVAKVKHGYAFSGEFFSKEEGPNILLTPGNFSKEKTLYFGPNTKFYQGPIPSDFILKNGDLLVVMTDLTPSMDILGNAVILNSDKAILHNQRIGKVEVESKHLAASFLRHVLNSERVQKQIKKSASGTTVRHTSPGRILENVIALPPMEEQFSIVEALRTIDDALYLQIQNLERISSLKSALMSDLLTGRKRVTSTLPMAAE